MENEKDYGRRKVKTFLHGKRPSLCHTGKNQLVKEAAHKGDVHKKQADRAGETVNNARIARKIIDDKCPGGDQEVHGVNTRHAVFEVLFEPVLR